MMAVKTLVLHGQDRFHEQRRNIGKLNHLALLPDALVESGHQLGLQLEIEHVFAGGQIFDPTDHRSLERYSDRHALALLGGKVEVVQKDFHGAPRDTVFAFPFGRGLAFEITEPAKLFGQFFGPHVDADVKQITVGIDLGREKPFPTFELFRDGIFQPPEIPGAENEAAGSDDEKRNQSDAEDAEIGFLQTQRLKLIFAQNGCKSNETRGSARTPRLVSSKESTLEGISAAA